MSDSPDALPQLRASDADRERVAEHLRGAHADGQLTVDELEERIHSAYAARTRAELVPLTADLSVPETHPGAAPAQPSGVEVHPGGGGARWVISVLGGSDKSGRWRVAPRCNVFSFMGGSDIDLNDAVLSAPVTEINVISIMGGADIRVPDGVHVEISEFSLMGGNDLHLADDAPPPPPDAPRIHLRLVALMGGADVKRGRKLTKAERRRERELRKAHRREELGERRRRDLAP